MSKFVEAYRAKMSKAATWVKTQGIKVRETFRKSEPELTAATTSEDGSAAAEAAPKPVWAVRAVRAVGRAVRTALGVLVTALVILATEFSRDITRSVVGSSLSSRTTRSSSASRSVRPSDCEA